MRQCIQNFDPRDKPAHSFRRAAASFNLPDAVNPAIALGMQFGGLWRGVTDPGRWAAGGAMFSRYWPWVIVVSLLASLHAYCEEPALSRQEGRVMVLVNQALPPYWFWFHRGKIEIASRYLQSRQTIKVLADRFNIPADGFDLGDINFDGYLDVATSEMGGSKWGICHYYVFDKKTGKFVANWLTRRLAKFKANEVVADPQSKVIRVFYLTPGDGIRKQAYQIKGKHLVLVEEIDIRSGNVITTKRLVEGRMKVIKTERR